MQSLIFAISSRVLSFMPSPPLSLASYTIWKTLLQISSLHPGKLPYASQLTPYMLIGKRFPAIPQLCYPDAVQLNHPLDCLLVSPVTYKRNDIFLYVLYFLMLDILYVQSLSLLLTLCLLHLHFCYPIWVQQPSFQSSYSQASSLALPLQDGLHILSRVKSVKYKFKYNNTPYYNILPEMEDKPRKPSSIFTFYPYYSPSPSKENKK